MINGELNNFLSSLANAFRAQKGTSDSINAQNFTNEIQQLPDEYDLAAQFLNKTVVSLTDNVGAIQSLTTTYCFQGFSLLTTINLPSCTSIAGGCFRQCSNLTTVILPSSAAVSYSCFAECTSLSVFSCNCAVSTGTFYSCSNLAYAKVKLTGNTAYTFQYCTNLQTLDLTGMTSATSASTTCFTSTPLLSGEGVVYVRPSLLTQFKSLVPWSSMNLQAKESED